MKLTSIMMISAVNDFLFYLKKEKDNKRLLAIGKIGICEIQSCKQKCLNNWYNHFYNNDTGRYIGYKMACCLCRQDETYCFLCSLKDEIRGKK